MKRWPLAQCRLAIALAEATLAYERSRTTRAWGRMVFARNAYQAWRQQGRRRQKGD